MHSSQNRNLNISLLLMAFLTPLLSLLGCRANGVPNELATTSIPTAIISTRNIKTATATIMIQPTVVLETAVPTPLPIPTTPPFPPLPTPQDSYGLTLNVPILMYHYISEPPEDADIYRIDLSVTPNNFRQQMTYLAENGFKTIDLYDLSAAIADQIELPPKPVIITIDDGYRDAYENAFPILQEFGLKATFFVATEFTDQGHEAYMTWPMVEELASAGMRIESITKTHADLVGQNRDYLIWQILGSQETIAAHIGYIPRYFAYPYGRYDDQTVQILKDLNFRGALTTTPGQTHDFSNRFEWNRARIRHDTPIGEFINLIDPSDAVSGK